jgi:hypothetical protein
MLDVVVDTFLTTLLYAVVDDFCRSHPPETRPGGVPLRRRGHHPRHLRPVVVPLRQRTRLLPLRQRPPQRRLPDPARSLPVQSAGALLHAELIEEMALHLAEAMVEARECPYDEAPDSSAMPVRDAERRGSGWPVAPTSDGPTAWGGTRASFCSAPSPPPGRSPQTSPLNL